MQYTHLLFDLDNTLLNFSDASLEALKDVAATLQLNYDDEFLEVYHDINFKLWKDFEHGLIDAIALRKKRFEDTAKHFKRNVDGLIINRRYIQGIIKNGKFIDGAEDLLEATKNSYSLNIITNGLKEAQRPRLKESKIYDIFDQIIVSDEIGYAKPHAQYFNHAWQKISQPSKDKVLVIGDSPNSDIRGGNNFGFDTCLFDPANKFATNEATFRITALKDLQKMLE